MQDLTGIDQVAQADLRVRPPECINGRATAVGDLAQGVTTDHGHAVTALPRNSWRSERGAGGCKRCKQHRDENK